MSMYALQETYSLESEADDGVRQASEALGSRGR
jgi:hypothetical protein